MSIEYKEIVTKEDIDQCIELQKSIFDLSDIDVISPLFLKLIARNNPPIGVSLGLFKSGSERSELIGFIIGFATFQQKSMYSVTLGIKPEYQNKIYGHRLMLKYREIALSKNIEFLYGLFDPLEAHIARFNISSLGYIAYQYVVDPENSIEMTGNKNIPNDKILVKWNINNVKTVERIKGIHKQHNQEFLNLPVVTHDNMPDLPAVLLEIPENFDYLMNNNVEEAIYWRNNTRAVFSEYLNKRQYIVSDCFSTKNMKKCKTYYLLEKL